ncbi:hypothetical protein L218DRAFT_966353 [Marasmius fiardii PR-910]|nr:hypothetical protein L218DRAFT_966353 [Marasmius fiardii PR-910]
MIDLSMMEMTIPQSAVTTQLPSPYACAFGPIILSQGDRLVLPLPDTQAVTNGDSSRDNSTTRASQGDAELGGTNVDIAWQAEDDDLSPTECSIMSSVGSAGAESPIPLSDTKDIPGSDLPQITCTTQEQVNVEGMEMSATQQTDGDTVILTKQSSIVFVDSTPTDTISSSPPDMEETTSCSSSWTEASVDYSSSALVTPPSSPYIATELPPRLRRPSRVFRIQPSPPRSFQLSSPSSHFDDEEEGLYGDFYEFIPTFDAVPCKARKTLERFGVPLPLLLEEDEAVFLTAVSPSGKSKSAGTNLEPEPEHTNSNVRMAIRNLLNPLDTSDERNSVNGDVRIELTLKRKRSVEDVGRVGSKRGRGRPRKDDLPSGVDGTMKSKESVRPTRSSARLQSRSQAQIDVVG